MDELVFLGVNLRFKLRKSFPNGTNRKLDDPRLTG